MPEERPSQIETQIHNLPAALNPLKSRDNWVLWKWERGRNPNSGASAKWTKVPYQPSGRRADSTDRSTYSSYQQVIEAVANFDGIGFCIGNDIAAFDVDKCRNSETGGIHPWATQLMEDAQTYAEVTISGTGLRVIGFGQGAAGGRKQPVGDGVTCESYRGGGRYIVMTGVSIHDMPLANIDAVMDATVIALDVLNDRQTNGSGATATSDDELWASIKDGGGGRHGVTRSENLWWVINEMVRRGYDKVKIKKTIVDRSHGISEHIYDQNNPLKYADKQIVKATEDLRFDPVDRHNRPKPTTVNGYIAIYKSGWSFRYDEFSDRMLMCKNDKIKDIDDADIIHIKIFFERNWHLFMSKASILDLVVESSRLNTFHPVRDYLSGLTWDGTPRIGNWLVKYCGSDDTEYVRAVGRLFMIAAVRRIMHPGSKFDEMMVLESPQGTEKSSLLAALAVQDNWFSDDLPLNVVGPRIIEHLRGRWIIEAGELSGMRRTDIEHLKAFLSRQIDRGRLAYDKIVSNVPRQSVFVGTTNSEEYLRDLTGNRRFWPVRVERVNIAGIKKDRDQLWAEAVLEEQSNSSNVLDERLWPSAEEEQSARLTIDPYIDAIDDKLNGKAGKITSNSVWTILNVSAGHRTQDQNQRLGIAMRKLGWKKAKIRVTDETENLHNDLVNGYTKGELPYLLIRAERNRDGDIFINYDGDDQPM
jgi:hypothetical protein